MAIDRVSGSGKAPHIPSDTGSAVVAEIQQQLAAAQALTSGTKDIATAATDLAARIFLGKWRSDVWIQDLLIINNTSADIDNVGPASAMLLKYASSGSVKVPGGTITTKFDVTLGSTVDKFGADTSFYATEFSADANKPGATINTAFSPFVLPANSILYFEFTNVEGVTHNITAQVSYAIADGINNLNGKIFQQIRNKNRGARKTLIG